MTTISVRRLASDDWPLYRTLRLAALADAPEAFGSTLEQEQAFTEEAWRERLARRNQFVAEDGDRARGLIGIVPDAPGTAQLVSMWVHPAARGRGAADLLVRAVLQWASDHGIPQVELWVTEGNGHAERLYARHDFQRDGRVQPVREGEPGLEFAMVRSGPVGDGHTDATAGSRR
ncbi:GNAT family N-acetyltransferase [Streptomyces sp. cg2]|uniref:GNAT family N-acetyltransferase n=1 Tax=Streptomyces sp. cg2 TaxID=3238799 RepID=UPI0034E200CB